MSKIISIKRKLPSITKHIFSWYFKYYILKRHSPLISTFHLTNRCNLRCKMCSQWRNPKKNTLPLKIFQPAIDDLGRMGCIYASFGGAEPMVIKDVFSYLSYAARRIPFINLVTNGQVLDSGAVKELDKTKIDTISISIDGLRKTHDEMRGAAGSFDRIMEGIENLKRFAPKISITVNTVISPWNLDELLSLADLTEGLGLLHKLQPIYHYHVFEGQETRTADWEMAEGQIIKLQEIVKKLRRKKNIANSPYFLSSVPAYFRGKNTEALFREECKVPSFYCEIRENGMLYSCIEGMEWKDGFSLFDHRLKDIFYSPDYRKAARGLRNCKKCREIMPICYMEPRIAFPISNYIKYTLMPSLGMVK